MMKPFPSFLLRTYGTVWSGWLSLLLIGFPTVASWAQCVATVDALTNQLVNTDQLTAPVSFTGNNNRPTIYRWTNSNPAIGLPASGTGSIASFRALNNTTGPLTATITVTPEQPILAYVANFLLNNVSVINTATNQVVSTISVGKYPVGVSVSWDGSRVYVANTGSNSVSVINTATNQVVASIDVGLEPHGVSVSLDGSQVYVTNVRDGNVSVINTATNQVVDNISVGINPRGISVSWDGSRVYVANTGSNSVSVINTATNQVVDNIGVGSSPFGVSVSPDGSRVYVANSLSNNVSVINTSNNQVVRTIGVQNLPYGVSVSPDGSRVYVTINGYNAVNIIDTVTNQVVAFISVGYEPTSLGTFVEPIGCTGSSQVFTITVKAPPLIRYVGLSTATVCSGSPFSLTATAANFSSPPTSYSLSASSTDLTVNNLTGVFAVNTPNVSSTTTYTLTVSAANSTESASTTALVTVNPTPTLVINQNGLASPTRCDTPDGRIDVTTNLPNGSYLLSYRKNTTNLQTASVVVTSGLFSLTGLSSGVYNDFSISTNSCTGVINSAIVLLNPSPPTVSITPSTTVVCAGQEARLTASGASIYVWSTEVTTSSISATTTGTYSVTGTNNNGCTGTASATVIVNQPPVVAITDLARVYCQNAGTQALKGSPTGGVFTIDGTLVTTFNPSSLSVGQHTVIYSYTNGSGCGNSVRQTVTVNPIPVVAITGLATAYCQDAGSATLAGSPTGGQFTLDGTPAKSFFPASLSVDQHTIVYSYTNGSGCANTATQRFSIRQTPTHPQIVTASGQPYQVGVSSLTVNQNTGLVILTVSGCDGGTITWNGGSSTTLAVSTASLGTQSFTATCTNNGCNSSVATATVTVVAPTLKVLSRDPDNGQLGNNTIKPYLLLQNADTTPIAYSSITLRYWLTTENNIPLIFQKNYVQIGQGNLNLRYVALTTPRQGATGYIEYSFNAEAGSLASNSDSGPLEVQATKQDYSRFVQSDDYSYINNSSFTLNPRVTAYQNGIIFYGQEPSGSGSGREAAPEVGSALSITVLGNPVVDQAAEVEISGARGQALQLKLTDLQGKTLHGHSIPEAGLVERVRVPLGSAQGLLLLEVRTQTQRQQIKLLRP